MPGFWRRRMRQGAERAAEGLGMTRDEIIKLFREMAKEHGYSCRDALAWRRFDELYGLVELDRSRFGPFLNIWYGGTTAAMVTREKPPSVGYWGESEKAGTVPHRLRRLFTRIADCDPKLTAEKCREGLAVLFEEVTGRYQDNAAYRAKLLEKWPDPADWGIVQDWAHGNVRAPSWYWPKTPYYK